MSDTEKNDKTLTESLEDETSNGKNHEDRNDNKIKHKAPSITFYKLQLDELKSLLEKEKDLRKFFKNKIIDKDLTYEEQKSMDVLSLKMPINVEKIKKTYKKLVKIFHPDVNKENKDAEKLFKDINQAYRILLKKFLKKS